MTTELLLEIALCIWIAKVLWPVVRGPLLWADRWIAEKAEEIRERERRKVIANAELKNASEKFRRTGEYP